MAPSTTSQRLAEVLAEIAGSGSAPGCSHGNAAGRLVACGRAGARHAAFLGNDVSTAAPSREAWRPHVRSTGLLPWHSGAQIETTRIRARRSSFMPCMKPLVCHPKLKHEFLFMGKSGPELDGKCLTVPMEGVGSFANLEMPNFNPDAAGGVSIAEPYGWFAASKDFVMWEESPSCKHGQVRYHMVEGEHDLHALNNLPEKDSAGGKLHTYHAKTITNLDPAAVVKMKEAMTQKDQRENCYDAPPAHYTSGGIKNIFGNNADDEVRWQIANRDVGGLCPVSTRIGGPPT